MGPLLTGPWPSLCLMTTDPVTSQLTVLQRSGILFFGDSEYLLGAYCAQGRVLTPGPVYQVFGDLALPFAPAPLPQLWAQDLFTGPQGAMHSHTPMPILSTPLW